MARNRGIEADAGPGTATAAEQAASNTTNAGSEDTPIDKRPPYEYICIIKPYYAGEDENDEDEDEDEEREETEPEGKSLFNKVASNHPDWPYKIMAQSWRNICDWTRRSSYTNPDLFNMHIFSDFHAYGALELLENLLIDLNQAFEDQDLDKMWAVIATMAHWLNHESSEAWIMVDDGERSAHTIHVLGVAFLAALHQLDRAGQLKADSRFQDLGLVMALFLKVGEIADTLEEQVEWVSKIIVYAQKAGIDLMKQGVDGIDADKLKEQVGEEEPLAESDLADRWQWAQKFKALEPRGGDHHNILLMPRLERAKHAFEGKDPLKDFSDKDLKAGNLEVA